MGDSNYIDPGMVGSWRNVHLEGYGDPDIKRVTTTWHFGSAADCSRYTESYSLAEDLTYTSLRNCEWLADGRVLVVLYAGAPDTVSYVYGFPTMRHDTLEIGGIRFANVGR